MIEFFLYWQHIYYVFVDVLFNRQSTFLCSYAPLLAYRIYPIELEIKDTTDTARSASYLNLHLEIDSEGRLRTKPYDTEMISIFLLWTVHFYVATSQQNLRMEFISQLIRYPSACVSYHDFLHKGLLQTRKLQNQGFLVVTLKSSLQKCYGRHHDLIDPLRNVCVKNDYGYVLFVVITIRSFPYS